jgi:hypothetical protein
MWKEVITLPPFWMNLLYYLFIYYYYYCLYHPDRRICCVRKNGEGCGEGNDTTRGCGEANRKWWP